jgi:hypothetical protein
VKNMMIQESMIEINQIQLTKKKNEKNNGEFEKTLLEAVDIAFSSLFNSQKENIYSYLNKCYKINKQEIPHNVENFAKALEETFGQSAQLIELEIMKTVYAMSQKFKFTSKMGGLTFTDYVKAMHDL